METSKIYIHDPKVEVASNQFFSNGAVIDLPRTGVTQEVAEAFCELMLHTAREGVGENTKAKGMLIVAGTMDDFEEYGYCAEGHNQFEHRDVNIMDWKNIKPAILPCFIQDKALFIEGRTGKIIADKYELVFDLKTKKQADQSGGTGHTNASTAGLKGLLAIKCSED